MRRANVERITKETQIPPHRRARRDGSAHHRDAHPFLNHMLDTVARHGLFDLEVEAQGDVEVDGHHTVEDVGIVLGTAFARRSATSAGIVRFGDATIPMDETLVTAAVDFCGRAAFVYKCRSARRRKLDRHLRRRAGARVLRRFAARALCNLHLEVRYGENAHHIVEVLFKAFARALRRGGRGRPRVGGRSRRPRGR